MTNLEAETQMSLASAIQPQRRSASLYGAEHQIVGDIEAQSFKKVRPAMLPQLVKRAGEGCSREHGVRWRSLTRKLDPFADPMLLELVEVVNKMCSPGALVALCGDFLRSRTGQRLATSVKAVGNRTLPAPNVTGFSAWLDAIQSSETEELVLVADWRVLVSCLAVINEATEDRGALIKLMGTIVLCSRQEKSEATVAAVGVRKSCPCKVIPSLTLERWSTAS